MHNAGGMSDEDSDESLMQAYASGDAAAFARLYDRHEAPVHRFFRRQSIAASVADDLLQETWLAVVRSADRYQATAKFTTWLYTIARSKLTDHWRATRAHAVLDDAANDANDDGDEPSMVETIAAPTSDQPEVRAMSRDRALAFVAAVEALPGPQREVFLMHVEGELGLNEIASLTAAGVETVKSRLRYAMKKLRAACADWLPAAAVSIEVHADDR